MINYFQLGLAIFRCCCYKQRHEENKAHREMQGLWLSLGSPRSQAEEMSEHKMSAMDWGAVT